MGRLHFASPSRTRLVVIAGTLLLHFFAIRWLLRPAQAGARSVDDRERPAEIEVMLRPIPVEMARVERLTSPKPVSTESTPSTRKHKEVPARSTTRATAATPSLSQALPTSPIAAAEFPASAAEPRLDARAVSTDHVPGNDAAPNPAPAPPAPDRAIAVARPDHGRCPAPPYPSLLREQGIEGVVKLRVKVDASGGAAEVQLLQASGWRLFDEAAMRQVRACRFVPARRGEEPLASWVEFPVRFALDG